MSKYTGTQVLGMLFLNLFQTYTQDQVIKKLTCSQYDQFEQALNDIQLFQYDNQWVERSHNLYTYLETLHKRLPCNAHSFELMILTFHSLVTIIAADRAMLSPNISEADYLYLDNLLNSTPEDKRNIYKDIIISNAKAILQMTFTYKKLYYHLERIVHHSASKKAILTMQKNNEDMFKHIQTYQSIEVPNIFSDDAYILSILSAQNIVYYDANQFNQHSESNQYFHLCDRLVPEEKNPCIETESVLVANATNDSIQKEEDLTVHFSTYGEGIHKQLSYIKFNANCDIFLRLNGNGELSLGGTPFHTKRFFQRIDKRKGVLYYEIIKSFLLADYANLVVPSCGIQLPSHHRPREKQKLSVEYVSKTILLPMIRQMNNSSSQPNMKLHYQEGFYQNDAGKLVTVRAHRRRLKNGQRAGHQAIALAKKMGWKLDPEKETLVQPYQKKIQSSNNTPKKGMYR